MRANHTCDARACATRLGLWRPALPLNGRLKLSFSNLKGKKLDPVRLGPAVGEKCPRREREGAAVLEAAAVPMDVLDVWTGRAL